MVYCPKVSIVIPAYNASNYLEDAIDSALAQTYKNLEIIVVNDGSKDEGATAAIAKRYGDKIRYFEKKNGGSSSALNLGISKMTGEWFSWLSHDDLYYPEKTEKQINFLNELFLKGENVEEHVLFSANELINGKGDCIYRPTQKANLKKHSSIEGLSSNAFLVAEAGGKYTFHGCTCFIHRNVFERIGFFDENLRLINDIDMWKRIYMSGYRVHCLSEVLVKGRVHSQQVSAKIGFSYHNEEQDNYWTSLLDWILVNCVSMGEYDEILLLFAKTAFSKTRNEEGKRAFCELLRNKTVIKRLKLRLSFLIFIAEIGVYNMLKRIYRKFFS